MPRWATQVNALHDLAHLHRLGARDLDVGGVGRRALHRGVAGEAVAVNDSHAEALTRALEEVSAQLRDVRATQRRIETVAEDSRARLIEIHAAIIPQGAAG